MCHLLLQSRSRTPRARTPVGQNSVASTCNCSWWWQDQRWELELWEEGRKCHLWPRGGVRCAGMWLAAPQASGGHEWAADWISGTSSFLLFHMLMLQRSSLTMGNLMQFCVSFISSCKTIMWLFVFHQSHHLKTENTSYLGVWETRLWLLCCLEWAPWCSHLFRPFGAADYLSLQ